MAPVKPLFDKGKEGAKSMQRALLIALLVIPFIACAGSSNGGKEHAKTLRFDGAVRHVFIEGGGWLIQADSKQLYQPVKLDQDFQKDGLRVRVVAKTAPDMASTLMMGQIIRIQKIERIEKPTGAN